MQQRSAALAPITFLRLQFFFVTTLIGVLVLSHPPSLREPAAMSVSGGADLPASKTAPLLRERDEAPYLVATHNVYLGPSKDYVVLGLLPRGGSVEVIGRNEAGDWLAITLASLRGWVPVTAVSGVEDVRSLAVVPETLLSTR